MEEERRVVNEERTDVTDDGTVVTERSVSKSSATGSKTTIANIIWYIYGFIAIVLSLRFVMKMAGANAGNAFVDIIYGFSGVLSAPFDTIFGVERVSSGDTTSVFEPSILVAIAVYALIAWGVAKLLTLNEPQS